MLAFYLSLLENDDEKELFTEIYEQNTEKMFYVAKSILSSDVLADEAVHDTFIKIIKNFTKFSALGIEHRNGWIMLATKYTSLNILKKEKKYIAVEDSYLFNVIDTQTNDEQADIYEDLAEAIRELPEKYSQVLELYYMQGYNSREIADILNIGVETIKKRMIRGRKILLELMEKY